MQCEEDNSLVKDESVTLLVVLNHSLARFFGLKINSAVVTAFAEGSKVFLCGKGSALVGDPNTEDPLEISNHSCVDIGIFKSAEDGGVVPMRGHMWTANPTNCISGNAIEMEEGSSGHGNSVFIERRL